MNWDSIWDVLWFFLAIFLWVAFFMVLFMVIGDLFRDRTMGGGGKAVWAIVLIFLPFLGTFIYLIARGSGMSDRAVAAAQHDQELAQRVRAERGGHRLAGVTQPIRSRGPSRCSTPVPSPRTSSTP